MMDGCRTHAVRPRLISYLLKGVDVDAAEAFGGFYFIILVRFSHSASDKTTTDFEQ